MGKKRTCSDRTTFFPLTLLHSVWPKLYGVLALLSAIGLTVVLISKMNFGPESWEPCYLRRLNSGSVLFPAEDGKTFPQ